MSIVFDVIILCFPAPVISGLHMQTRRKLVIAGIFWLGGFCCIASALRFWVLYQSIYQVSVSTSETRYSGATAGFIWSHIEPNCSVIAACLPTYGTLFTGSYSVNSLVQRLGSFMSLGSRSSKNKTGGGSNSGTGGGTSSLIPNASQPGANYEMRSSKNAWQKLDASNNSVEITSDRPEFMSDLEAQKEDRSYYGISVRREFGSQVRHG
jgi:hypothetical protein